jgi:hypothetical protein
MLRETKHDYQNCLVGNFYNSAVNGTYSSWNDFKNYHYGFTKDDATFEHYDDTYHFVFRYDIHKNEDEKYTLEICMMFQRKGIYSHIYVKNITAEELDTEVNLWLKGRLKYLKGLWAEIDIEK